MPVEDFSEGPKHAIPRLTKAVERWEDIPAGYVIKTNYGDLGIRTAKGWIHVVNTKEFTIDNPRNQCEVFLLDDGRRLHIVMALRYWGLVDSTCLAQPLNNSF